jgi:RNA polymerase subunit RPABC4/transcription elongation factor Spt4
MAGREVVARWWVRRQRARVQACMDCVRVFDGVVCPACGLLAEAVPVAAMAVVVELEGGARRLVVVERGEAGRWFASRTLPATDEAIRALRRQHQPHGEDCGGWAA